MSTLKNLEELKARAEKMRQQADRAQGALEQTKKQLKEEFEVDSVEEAEKLLKKMETKERQAKEEFETAQTAFMEKWGEELSD